MINYENQHGNSNLSDLSKITREAGITLGGSIGGKGLLFLYTIFLAKVLGPSDLGLYFLGITIIGFLTVLATMGLNAGVVRFVALYNGKNDRSRTKGTILISAALTLVPSLIMVGIILLVGDLIATYIFHKPELGTVIKLLSLAIPFDSLMRIFLAATRGFKLMKFSVYTENLAWVGIRIFFALFFLYGLGMGLEGIVFAYVASSVISMVIAFCFVNRLIPLLGKKISPIFEVRKLLRFSIPMLFSIFLGNLIRQIDILMLGLFVSLEGVGIYSVAVRVIALAEVIFMAFQPIFNPFVAELHDKKEFVKLSNLLKVITRWNVTISLPIFLSLLIFPGFFLNIIGKGFTQASGCLSVLVIAHLFSSVSSLPSSMIFMSGRSDITLKNNLIVLITNIVLNYLLIPKYGIMGAAFATGSSLVLIAFIRIAEVYYLMRIHPFKIDLWKPISAGLISLVIILFLHTNFSIEGNTFTIILLSIFFLVYSLFIYFFKLNEEDLYIKSIIKKKLTALTKQGAI